MADQNRLRNMNAHHALGLHDHQPRVVIPTHRDMATDAAVHGLAQKIVLGILEAWYLDRIGAGLC